MTPTVHVAETCDEMLRKEIPNLFRPFVNPYVAGACRCLERYVAEAWPDFGPARVFLANSFDEAFGGAVKLARYAANQEERSSNGLIVGRDRRLDHVVAADTPHGSVAFIPGLIAVDDEAALAGAAEKNRFGFTVLSNDVVDASQSLRRQLERLVARDTLRVVACVDRATIAALRNGSRPLAAGVTPDVVVFDESFVAGEVPFAAFVARRPLFDLWSGPGMQTFHSTTFQPNTIASLHFLRRLPIDDPGFYAACRLELDRIELDPQFRTARFRDAYSAPLVRLAAVLGFDRGKVRAAGHYVVVDGCRVFDGVAGVACSVRGHNPPGFVREAASLPSDGLHESLERRFASLTGLSTLTPAVSGATAVESALKIALVAQAPRRRVVALRGGFGGKTPLALTGTAFDSYKRGLSPLYGEVTYVDAFADDAIERLDAVLKDDVAVVQIELVQGVGGVRALPPEVLRFLCEERRRGYLILVDEVQTGMHRTGPFVRCRELGLVPDLLTVGKALSDMMVPFAAAMCSDSVRDRLAATGSPLLRQLRSAYGREWGYRTAINAVYQAERLGLEDRVRRSARLFQRHLADLPTRCPAVRDVRIFGLLIGIELATDGWSRRLLKGNLDKLRLLEMASHGPFPLLMGFCQAAPHVLKLTPPLTIEDDEIRGVCDTITTVLNRPAAGIMRAGVVRLLGPKLRLRRHTSSKMERRP